MFLLVVVGGLERTYGYIQNKQSTSQPSFIRNDLINGEITNDVWWEN